MTYITFLVFRGQIYNNGFWDKLVFRKVQVYELNPCMLYLFCSVETPCMHIYLFGKAFSLVLHAHANSSGIIAPK